MPCGDTKRKPVAIVLTGLPGTGKSTLSKALFEKSREMSMRCYIVSKDWCKSILVVLRSLDPDLRAWRDPSGLRHRLAGARGALARQEASGGYLLAEFGGELESYCAERLGQLAAHSSVPTRGVDYADDDTLNAWSYQLMLDVTDFVLEKNCDVILDAPLYRVDVVRGLINALARNNAAVFVFTCRIEDEMVWDDRLRKRKLAETEDDSVKKPGSVSEVTALYQENETRKVECREVERVMKEWRVSGRLIIDTGRSSVEDQVQSILREMSG